MPRSTAETDKRAMARIQRLCCLGAGGEMLMPDLIQEMSGLVPLQLQTFFWLGPNLEITNTYGTLPAELKKVYFEQVSGGRIDREVWVPYWECVVRRGSSLVQRAAEIMCIDERGFLRSDYFNLLIRPVEAYEPLLIPLREGRRVHGMFFIWRAASEAPFDSRKLKILEAMAGFIAHGMTRTQVGEDVFADSGDRALFVADSGGTLRYIGVQAQQLLMMALNPRWSPATSFRGPREPTPEVAWLCRALAATARGEIGQQPPVLTLRNQWGEFVLRAYWLGPTDGVEQTRHIGITIERRVPRTLALRRRIEGLLLTGREKQLCLHLARDPSSRDLSDAMGLSPSTVITHQRSVYAKLGVHSRAELLSALQRT